MDSNSKSNRNQVLQMLKVLAFSFIVCLCLGILAGCATPGYKFALTPEQEAVCKERGCVVMPRSLMEKLTADYKEPVEPEPYACTWRDYAGYW